VFEDLLQRWDGEEAVIRFDEPSGAWMFVCVHSTVLGPAGGGTRMRDQLCFAAPLGPVGQIAEVVVLRRYLAKFLGQRNAMIRRAAEDRGESWKRYLEGS